MNQKKTDEFLRLSLINYLERTGWQRISRGVGGEVWSSDPLTQADVAAVPNLVREKSVEFEGAALRISAKEQRDVALVADDIKHEFYDLQSYRIGDAFVEDDAVPLEAASTVLRSAQRILRIAGTTSRKPTPRIGSNFSKFGDATAARARLSHTRRGSFVLPVIMPVVGDDELGSPLMFVRDQVESIERVLTRTAASAIDGINQAVVQPSRVPTRSDVLDLIDVGVSAELVTAVRDITRQSGVGMLDTTFRWSPAMDGGKQMPTRIAIPAEASEILNRVAVQLREARPDPEEFVSGRVVEIHHVPDEPAGYITLRVLRGKRFSEVQVHVSAEVINVAHSWMSGKMVISARGTLERRPGQPLRMLTPVSVEPLDEVVNDHSSRPA